MELTVEAIEHDLLLAEQTMGRPGYELHLARARIRASLIPKIETAATESPIMIGPTDVDVRILNSTFGEVYVIPFTASVNDKAEAVAHIWKVGKGVDEDNDVTDEGDIFADARKERRK